MSAILPPPERLWWKQPIDRVEGLWIGIALVWCLIMFFMMPYWHIYGQQNLSNEAWRTTPEAYMKKAEEMVAKHKVREETDQKIPVVHPAVGSDVYLVARLWSWWPILELEAGKSYTVGEVRFSTPVRHDHTAETYGIRFDAAGHTFSYITDTRYFDGLIPAYAGSELVIMNIVLVHRRETIAHLAVPDAENLVRELKPKVAILTHYGMGVWQAHPWEIAEKMSAATGVMVKAGRDGMKFDLAELGQA